MGINAAAIQKLYIAYFNRPADVSGLSYWEGQLDGNKISLAGLAQSFSEQLEYVATYGGKSTADVVTALYQNLFGRAPDADGLKYWATQIDTHAVNLGTAALAILSGATPQSQDGVTIQNKLNFAAGFTTSLDTPDKAALYNSAYPFQVMRSILSAVTATGAPPTLVPSSPIKILEATNGISNAERIAGMDVLVDLKGVQTSAGYKLELMDGNSSFAVPVTHVLTADEATSQKAVIHIPAGINWGTDGGKLLGIKVTDIFGNSGKVGAQTSVVLDTTAPVLPTSGIIFTYWTNQQPKGLDYVLGEIQYKIFQGENTGGSAVLLDNGTPIGQVSNIAANASMLDFVIDPQIAKQVYNDYFVSKVGLLSLLLTDVAGNSVTTRLNDYKINTEYKEKVGLPASNISMHTGGFNGNLVVQANMNGVDYFKGKAYLKIDGQVVAVDDSISPGDTTVDFNIVASSSVQIQNLINKGGVMSVALIDANGRTVESTDNPILGANQYGSHTYIDSNAIPPILPKAGTYFTAYINQPTFDFVMNEIRYPIVPGQNIGGSAALLEGGNVIARIPSIGASDAVLDFVFDAKLGKQVYNDYFTNNNLSLVVTNAAGYSVSASLSGIGIYTEYKYKDGTPASNISLTPVGGNAGLNTLNNSTTNLLVTANINGWEYSMSKAYLKLNGKIIAIDDTISSIDKTVNFNLGTSDAVQLQAIVKSGGVVSITMIDMNGTQVDSISNPYLTTNFTAGFAAHDSHSGTATMVSEPASVTIIGQSQHLQHMDMVMS